MATEPSHLVLHAPDLIPRPWAVERIDGWLWDPNGSTIMLIEGPPGSGKSSVLLQYVTRLRELGQRQEEATVQLAASVLRHPRLEEPFDSGQFLGTVIEGLAAFAGSGERYQLPLSAPQVSVQQEGRAETMIGVAITGATLSAMSGLLPLARQRIKSTPAAHRALIVIDALDQAEDEGANDFLEILAALTKAAQGTGVRFLCASRTTGSIWLEPEQRTALNIMDDSDDVDAELRAFLRHRLQAAPPEDRHRLIEALVEGAQAGHLRGPRAVAAVVGPLDHYRVTVHMRSHHTCLFQDVEPPTLPTFSQRSAGSHGGAAGRLGTLAPGQRRISRPGSALHDR